MSSRKGRVLAIDYGERRIGLAISDREQTMAFPLKTVDTRKADLLTTLQDLIREYDIQVIVLGDPLRTDGQIGTAAEKIRQLRDELIQRFALPVILVDERLTSIEAQQRLKEIGGTKRDKGRIDAVAAMIILESYLQSRKNNET